MFFIRKRWIVICVSSAIRWRLWPAVFQWNRGSAEQSLEVSAKLFDVFDQHAIALRGLASMSEPCTMETYSIARLLGSKAARGA